MGDGDSSVFDPATHRVDEMGEFITLTAANH